MGSKAVVLELIMLELLVGTCVNEVGMFEAELLLVKKEEGGAWVVKLSGAPVVVVVAGCEVAMVTMVCELVMRLMVEAVEVVIVIVVKGVMVVEIEVPGVRVVV